MLLYNISHLGVTYIYILYQSRPLAPLDVANVRISMYTNKNHTHYYMSIKQSMCWSVKFGSPDIYVSDSFTIDSSR